MGIRKIRKYIKNKIICLNSVSLNFSLFSDLNNLHFKMDIRQYIFPKTKDWKKLQISEEGKYSVSYPAHAQKVVAAISDIMEKTYDIPAAKVTITDASACVGGDTIQFAQAFGHINCVEYNAEHMQMLKNNLKIFGLTNKCTFYLGSYEDYCEKLDQDVVYCDPPWGGPEYATRKKITLKYGETGIEDLILRAKFKLAVLKLPRNYDREYLSEKLPGIIIQELRKKSGDVLYLICFYHNQT